jgi:hypothetical protein
MSGVNFEEKKKEKSKLHTVDIDLAGGTIN